MRDNEIIAAIKEQLVEGLAAMQITADVKSRRQPTQQGINSTPCVYFFKFTPDKRYGFLQRKDEWVANPPVTDPVTPPYMKHTERQVYESKFQISALSQQDPNDLEQLTASDICNACAAILQSDRVRLNLRALGIGMERVTEVRNDPFTDDKDRNEFDPNFDFTVTHEQVIITTSPSVATTEVNIQRV